LLQHAGAGKGTPLRVELPMPHSLIPARVVNPSRHRNYPSGDGRGAAGLRRARFHSGRGLGWYQSPHQHIPAHQVLPFTYQSTSTDEQYRKCALYVWGPLAAVWLAVSRAVLVVMWATACAWCSGYVEPMLDEAPKDVDHVFEKALQLNTILHVRLHQRQTRTHTLFLYETHTHTHRHTHTHPLFLLVFTYTHTLHAYLSCLKPNFPLPFSHFAAALAASL
jgi:hypothetical protein